MKKFAFTMAEVLITLGIIGIVAAMTLPALIGNYKKKVTVTRLQRTYTVLAQAFERSRADNGDPSEWGLGAYSNTEATVENLKEILESFSRVYMVPYLAKIQSNEFGSMQDIGYKKIKCNGTSCYEGANNRYLTAKGLILVLNDGTTLRVTMDTRNLGTSEDRDDRWMFITIFADINGLSGPNETGKDIFAFIVHPSGKLGFYNLDTEYTRNQKLNLCKSSGIRCGDLIMTDGWEIKDDYPYKL